MTTPNRDHIIQAYTKLNDLCDSLYMGWGMSTDNINISKRAILDVLPPIPEPTMAEIEWDEDQHYLAEARTSHGPVIMLAKVYDSADGETYIRCITKDSDKDAVLNIYPASRLIPTGKRYTLN